MDGEDVVSHGESSFLNFAANLERADLGWAS
jgi:hypothetical protein